MVCVVFSSPMCYDFVFCDWRVCLNHSVCGMGEVANSVNGRLLAFRNNKDIYSHLLICISASMRHWDLSWWSLVGKRYIFLWLMASWSLKIPSDLDVRACQYISICTAQSLVIDTLSLSSLSWAEDCASQRLSVSKGVPWRADLQSSSPPIVPLSPSVSGLLGISRMKSYNYLFRNGLGALDNIMFKV